MAENKILDTVIILRNDQTTAWEDANAYTLEPGEVGIGRLTRADGSEVVIAKVGNGADTWQDLPQIEGVLESDITLTYNFGRHKTANGSVDAGGKGMTMSEWLIDALSEVVRPKVNAPYTSLSAKAYIEGSTTAATSAEIGSRITAIGWDGTFSAGSYVNPNDTNSTYGTVENGTGTKTNATGLSASSVVWAVSNNKDSQTATTEDGTFTLVSDDYIQLTSESATTYAKITQKANYKDNVVARTPLNNVGKPSEVDKISTTNPAEGYKFTKEANVSVSAYRKPFWAVLTSPLTVGTLTSDQVRGLSSSGTSTKGFPTTLSVPAGSRQVIFCAKAGAYSTLAAKDTAAMNAGVTFTKHANVVNVKGANNYAETAYDVWEVTWADPIASAKSLSLTWS
jgi:hypothetical protein